MTKQDVISYWQQSATEDLKTAEALFSLKRYDHSLFFCHMVLEKLLKGLVFEKTGKHALPIHNLVKLAQQAGLPLTPPQQRELEEITTWNIKARYDSIKRDFYHKATYQFTKGWLSKIKELFIWFKQQY